MAESTRFAERMLILKAERLQVELDAAQLKAKLHADGRKQMLLEKDREHCAIRAANAELQLEVLKWRKEVSVLTLKKASAEEDLRMQQENQQSLARLLTSALDERAALEQQLVQLQAQIARMQAMEHAQQCNQQDNLAGKDQELQRLHQQVTSLHDQISELAAAKTQLRSLLSSAQAERDAAQKCTCEARQQSNAAEGALAAQQLQMDRLKSGLTAANEKLVAAEEQVRASHAKATAAMEEARQAQAAAHLAEHSKAVVEAKLAGLQSLAQATQELAQQREHVAQERVKFTTERSTALETQLQAQINSLQSQLSEADAFRKQREPVLQRQLAALQEEVQQLKNKLADKTARLHQLEEDLQEKQTLGVVSKFLGNILPQQPPTQQGAFACLPSLHAGPQSLPGQNYMPSMLGPAGILHASNQMMPAYAPQPQLPHVAPAGTSAAAYTQLAQGFNASLHPQPGAAAAAAPIQERPVTQQPLPAGQGPPAHAGTAASRAGVVAEEELQQQVVERGPAANAAGTKKTGRQRATAAGGRKAVGGARKRKAADSDDDEEEGQEEAADADDHDKQHASDDDNEDDNGGGQIAGKAAGRGRAARSARQTQAGGSQQGKQPAAANKRAAPSKQERPASRRRTVRGHSSEEDAAEGDAVNTGEVQGEQQPVADGSQPAGKQTSKPSMAIVDKKVRNRSRLARSTTAAAIAADHADEQQAEERDGQPEAEERQAAQKPTAAAAAASLALPPARAVGGTQQPAAHNTQVADPPLAHQQAAVAAPAQSFAPVRLLQTAVEEVTNTFPSMQPQIAVNPAQAMNRQFIAGASAMRSRSMKNAVPLLSMASQQRGSVKPALTSLGRQAERVPPGMLMDLVPKLARSK